MDPFLSRRLKQKGLKVMLGIEKKPYPSVEALRDIQRMMGLMNPKVSKVRPEELIDARIIRKLDESGFIDSLYDSRKRWPS